MSNLVTDVAAVHDVRTASAAALELDNNGFLVLEPLLPPDECDRLNAAIASLRLSRAGSRRLLREPVFRDLARKLRGLAPVAALLPGDAVVVQCTLFAKTPETNWSVMPHQDLSIPVKERVDTDGYACWSRKETDWFVQPPVSLLERLLAVRLQLDADAAETGPLEVVPESHRLGRLGNDDIVRHAAGHRVRCVPRRGGAVVLRPLTIHASSKAVSAKPRRVLHMLFGPAELPVGLRWADSV